MKYRVGQTLFEVVADDETGVVTTDEWRVSVIREDMVHAIMVCSLTWGKRSKKHGDFGWLPNIPKWLKHAFPAASGSRRIFTTKRQACLAELKCLRDGNITDDEAVKEKIEKTLKSMMQRVSVARAKKARLAKNKSPDSPPA